MFDEMPQQDIVSWIELIVAYARSGDMNSAQNLFDEKPLRHLFNTSSLHYKSSLPDEAVYEKQNPGVTWPKQLNALLEIVDPEIADIIELKNFVSMEELLLCSIVSIRWRAANGMVVMVLVSVLIVLSMLRDLLVPGLYFCFKRFSDATIFIVMYGLTSMYFVGIMV
ncbi:Tetratricopeptide-like helical domain superfamily [Sesbania bispinosa]|nr:Tetratricopeptide-like helical domain superfamily [Sesbania bispinosa]